MSGFAIQEFTEENLQVGLFPRLTEMGFVHGVSGRHGGVSQTPFDSLNLGLHVGDDAARVCINRQRFCRALAVELDQCVTAEQVHGDRIAIVGAGEKGMGSREFATALPGVDALITDAADVFLLLFFADCVPILLADPVRRVCAAVHAGWKGSYQGIAVKTMQAMTDRFGSRPGDCWAFIGPSIGACCYEVSEELVEKFRNAYPEWDSKFIIGRNLDLPRLNQYQLVSVGVTEQQIATSGVCTSCNHDVFFSHRADKGRTGRLGALIGVKSGL